MILHRNENNLADKFETKRASKLKIPNLLPSYFLLYCFRCSGYMSYIVSLVR